LYHVDSPGGVRASGQRAADAAVADGRNAQSSAGVLGPVYLPPSAGVNSNLARTHYHAGVDRVILPPAQHDGASLPGPRYFVTDDMS